MFICNALEHFLASSCNSLQLVLLHLLWTITQSSQQGQLFVVMASFLQDYILCIHGNLKKNLKTRLDMMMVSSWTQIQKSLIQSCKTINRDLQSFTSPPFFFGAFRSFESYRKQSTKIFCRIFTKKPSDVRNQPIKRAQMQASHCPVR